MGSVAFCDDFDRSHFIFRPAVTFLAGSYIPKKTRIRQKLIFFLFLKMAALNVLDLDSASNSDDFDMSRVAYKIFHYIFSQIQKTRIHDFEVAVLAPAS